MSNVTTLIFVESRYKVSRKRIKNVVARTLTTNNIHSNVEVSVAIVGDRKMTLLNGKYRNKTGTTNILSFPLAEGEQTKLPETNTTHLGDIVISYPVVIKEAARDDMLVDEKVEQLVEHGLNHLLGIHHE
ncbi:MAG: rRNA maturation RNase YbeY [bacterium]|nr:rRNA maturation RNase YbeY [bacterium]